MSKRRISKLPKSKMTAVERAVIRQQVSVVRWQRELAEEDERHSKEKARLIQKIEDAKTVLKTLSRPS